MGQGEAREPCFQIPEGVDFLRWDGGDEWVVYHSGTGETLRLSAGALAIIDLLVEKRAPLFETNIVRGVAALLEETAEYAAVAAAVSEMLKMLVRHECVDRMPCD